MSNNTEFTGMTALVTGASSGIGAEAAMQFAERGARVLVHYNAGRERAEAVLARIQQTGGQAELLRADLSTLEGARQLIAAIKDTQIDILINNAGSLIRRTRVLDIDEELWNRTMMLNLTSAFYLAQAVLKGMVERKRGFIVNVGSVAGRTGGGIGASAYAAAKGAISALTKALTKEFASAGIRVNCVSPGTIDTNYHRQFSTATMLDAVRAHTPVGRLGESDETAEVIVWLCTDAARFVHGQTIEVNGGFFML